MRLYVNFFFPVQGKGSYSVMYFAQVLALTEESQPGTNCTPNEKKLNARESLIQIYVYV